MSKYKLSILVLFFTLFSSTAFASPGSYLGVGIGNASWDLTPTPFGTYDLEDSAAFKIYFGSKTGNLGGEMEFSFSSHDWDGFNATHNAGSFIFSGLAYLPVSDTVELFGKVGFNMWSTTVDLDGVVYEGESGIDLAFGAGLNIMLTETGGVRFEYQSLPGFDDGIDSGDITQFTINAHMGLHY